MGKPLRVDLVFSYWVYFWYLLYALKITNYSPKFPLIIGLIDNLIMFILMLMYGTSGSTIFYFIVINTLIKVVPLYYLRNESINMRDVYFTAFLFLIFIIWLHINKRSLIGNIKLIYESLLYGKEETPFIAFIKKVKKTLKN
jgi:hypothetical protein